MILPHDAVIAPAKFNRYLLIPPKRNDKATWLAAGRYVLANWPLLQEDLREQILSLDAIFLEETDYGRMYGIAGTLQGPKGKILNVRSIWIVETGTGQTKFVMLFPDKG